MKKRILALPHIGSAFGHFFRLCDFLHTRHKNDEIYLLLPKSFPSKLLNHISNKTKNIYYEHSWTATNKYGKLDITGFMKAVEERKQIIQTLKPDLIIGDPGIFVSIIATDLSIPWVALSHGCYLPNPITDEDNELFEIANAAWNKVNDYLDVLIKRGTNCKFNSWKSIAKTGSIIIPNNIKYEPSPIGSYFNSSYSKGWDFSKPVKTLITTCSSNDVLPSSDFLKKLHSKVGKVTTRSKENLNFINEHNKKYHYSSLVNSETTVITHGGHGTLKAISKAKKVFVVPGDIDQLCNGIIAKLTRGYKLVFDRDWLTYLNSSAPLERKINWNMIEVYESKNSFELKGK